MSIYKTVSGDTFDIIAKKELGDEKLAGRIIEKNIDYADVVFFQASIDIEILEEDEITEEVSENLPPWKRDE